MNNLFDPYVTTKSSGSGLGLAIVQKIVDEHGGTVRVGSARDGGAKFTIRLPLSEAAGNSGETSADDSRQSRAMS